MIFLYQLKMRVLPMVCAGTTLGRVATVRVFAAAGLAACLLAGCGTIASISELLFPKISKLEVGDIQLLSDPGTNLNTALEFEVVVVKDADLLKKLSDLPASKWFETREDIRKTFPEGFESKKWELVPGQDLRLPGDAYKDMRALAMIVFANYLTPGEHRARIDIFRQGAVIRLLPRGFTVEAKGAAASSEKPK